MYLFIHINKCGGTSLKRALQPHLDVFIPQNNELIKLSDQESWQDYKKFTIIRNPIDRVLSLQGMLLKRNKLDISIDEILDIVEDESIAYNRLSPQPVYIKRHGLPMTHPHYQVYKDGKINVDKYWKLEELNEVLPEIEEYLGRKLDIPKLNTSKKKQATDKEIERIKKVYAKDFEVFYKDQL